MDGSTVFVTLRRSASYPTDASLGPSEYIPHRFSHCAQLTAEIPYTLQLAAPFPLKLPLSMGGSGPHPIHCSLGPP